MEATASILSSHFHTSKPLPCHKFPLFPKPSSSSIRFNISISTPSLSLKFPLYPFKPPSFRETFELQSAVEEVVLEEIPKEIRDGSQKRKLYVVNLPYSLTVDDLKNAFSECGTVKDVEFIKNKDGKNRGYAFVTMASGDEAQAVVDKFHSKELSGRTIRVEFAKRLKKPRPQPESPAIIPVKETRHKLYVSNLQWKVRSSDLREFFSANFKPISTRVVFESPSGRSGGYGFVSFSTREEAEAAISSLDGKELLGRPVRLKFSEKTNEGEGGNEEEQRDGLDEHGRGIGEEQVVEKEADNS